MNYIQKLLNGEKVEWRTLGEVCEILNGYAFQSSKYVNNGIRIIRISDVQKGKISNKDLKFYPIEYKDKIKNYLLCENDLLMSLTGYVGRVAMLSKNDLPAGLNQRVACIRPNNNQVNIRYLFHYLDRSNFENDAIANAVGGGQKNMSTKWLSEYTIPIPPLPVQEKIAEILDRFAELEAELEAELHLREKQYAYYRNYLLTPNEQDLLNGKKVEWKSLGEICDVLRGRRLTKRDLVENGSYPVYHGGIEPIGYYNQHNREANSTMIINVGASAGTVGFSDREFWSSDGCYCFSHNDNVSQRFLFYFLQNMEIAIKSKVRKAGIPTLDSNVIEKIKIPIPPMEEQERIVKILDKFDTLVNSISEGLPKEIALRRKQYEYYREQLLSF